MQNKQLFFTASDGTKLRSPQYWLMLRKSIKLILDKTSFNINLIYDGDSALDDIPNAVNVIRHQHRLLSRFESCSTNTHIEWLDICRSTYLKTEVPYIANELGIIGNVLYIDVDCFITQDFAINYTGKPFWACSIRRDDKTHFCPGVMIMNVNRLLNHDDRILDHIDNNVDRNRVYDFNTWNALFPLNTYGLLPLEYNWKPVWGINERVNILHFSGAKPHSIELAHRIPHVKQLIDPNPIAFKHYSDWFDAIMP